MNVYFISIPGGVKTERKINHIFINKASLACQLLCLTVQDMWTTLHIGDVELRAIDHCSRCLMITVDPEKGVKDQEEEPLSTLKK